MSVTEEAKTLPTRQVIRFLVDNLGRRLTGAVAGLSGNAPVEAWTSPRGPNAAQEARLRTAYEAFTLIASREGPHIARAWMIGVNPHLDDSNPILCIAQDRYHNVLEAAQVHIGGDFG